MRAAGRLTYENQAQAAPAERTRLAGCAADVGQRTDVLASWGAGSMQQALEEALHEQKS